MKKVISINDAEIPVLVTREASEKNKWWITHEVEVEILPVGETPEISAEPLAGNIMLSGKRYYIVTSSKKVLICTICQQKANFKIGYRFYCKKHYKHLMLTKPIRRTIINPERNAPCSCGSGQKFKNCCLSKSDHKPRHYFNSLFMEDPKIVKSLNTIVH